MAKGKVNRTLSENELVALFNYITGKTVEETLSSSGISNRALYKLLDDFAIPRKSNRDTYLHYRQEIRSRSVIDKKSVGQISREVNLPEDLVRRFLVHEYNLAKEQQKRKAAESKPVVETRGLGKAGLIGHLPSSNKPGLSISQTLEEKQKRESVEDDSSNVEKFADMLEEGFEESEKEKLALLRALLKHASEKTDMQDYSEDVLLLPDYLLPIDLVIMKDITKRSVSGEKVKSIAAVHRTDEKLVSDLLTKGLSRDAFRNRYIKSLVDRGLIQF